MPGPDIFAGLPRAELQAQLAATQRAYMALAGGQKIATASYAQGDGAKSVTYTTADLGQMTMLIKQLQKTLGILPRARRPMRFIY